MKYAHILRYVAATPWAIEADKMRELLDILAFRAAGHTYTAEEIQARIGAGGSSPAASQGSGVAVIPMRGVIAHRMGAMDDSSGGTSTERISAMLRQVAADASIGTIVLDVDSPGGTVPGVSELAGELFEIKGRGTQKIVAVANAMMASAAYWLASQADEIVAIPSATVGSIGVFAVHEDLSAALAQEGIKVSVISAGKFKVEGNPFEPLSDEAKAVMQGKVDTAYAQFVHDVARGRKVTAKAITDGYGEGRALSAKDALAAGLIDRIGTLESVIREAQHPAPADERRRRLRIA